MVGGIATKDNVKLLKEKNLPCILITRGPRNAAYLEEFENHESDPEFKKIVRLEERYAGLNKHFEG